jgi:integrase
MPSIIVKRGKKVCMASVMVGGKRKQKIFPVGRKGEKEAVLWEEAAKEKLASLAREEEKKVIHSDCLVVIEWANAYLEYSQSRFAPKTFQEKRSAFKLVVKHFGDDLELNRITPYLCLNFLTKQAETRSGYAANKDRKNLVVAWDWGAKYLEGFPKMENPFHAVDRFPEQRLARYVPTEEDFWKVYDYAQDQDKAMLTAFLYLAARRGEVFRMKMEDIDWKGNQIRLWTQKRKGGSMEYDWLPMAEELKNSLKEWLKIRFGLQNVRDRQHVFVCVGDSICGENYGQPYKVRQHFMKRLCKRAGVKPFGFHAIRHLTASILYRKGYSVSVIQSILRHKSPNTTARYIRSLGMDHVKVALEDIRGEVVELKNKKAAAANNGLKR